MNLSNHSKNLVSYRLVTVLRMIRQFVSVLLVRKNGASAIIAVSSTPLRRYIDGGPK